MADTTEETRHPAAAPPSGSARSGVLVPRTRRDLRLLWIALGGVVALLMLATMVAAATYDPDLGDAAIAVTVAGNT